MSNPFTISCCEKEILFMKIDKNRKREKVLMLVVKLGSVSKKQQA
tara:strand:- start:268 stop:402 length:135 start_codon:yes stop_codon:yes gene_type:complete